jgi:ribosomal protein L32
VRDAGSKQRRQQRKSHDNTSAWILHSKMYSK